MSKYRTKEIIQAFKWTGGPDQTEDPEWICEALKVGVVKITKTAPGVTLNDGGELRMIMPHGSGIAIPGDFIILRGWGDIESMPAEVFNAHYEPA